MKEEYSSGQLLTEKVTQNIQKVIIGKESIVKFLLTAVLADGHVLLEDVPGTGKTRLAKSLARSLDLKYSRIQFTPDLLPTDITGLNIFDRQKNEFVLRKGPVFTNILLADEINRATPRTQAGLLECMEERQVTIDGATYETGAPFFVIATQNPVETAGTFPLPEAQLDRFMMKLSMGLPKKEEELSILNCYMDHDPLFSLQAVLSSEEIMDAREQANQVFVHQSVLQYMVDIIESTRNAEGVLMGVSPRGSLALLKCAKAYAYLSGRSYVNPDDIKMLAGPVLTHRILMGYGDTKGAEKILTQVIAHIPVPTEDFTK